MPLPMKPLFTSETELTNVLIKELVLSRFCIAKTREVLDPRTGENIYLKHHLSFLLKPACTYCR